MLQVATFRDSTIGAGDLRALLRTTVVDVESDFGTLKKLSAQRKLSLALSLLKSTDEKNAYRDTTLGLSEALSKLQIDDRHYWISTFYTLLMEASERREKAWLHFANAFLCSNATVQRIHEGFCRARFGGHGRRWLRPIGTDGAVGKSSPH